MKQITEDEQVQAWADVLVDILALVPPDQRARVLWLLSPQGAKMDHWRDEIGNDAEWETACASWWCTR